MISEFLAGTDLLSLRLSHRQLTAAADDAFARTFFEDRTHLFTKQGIEALLQICRRPNWKRKIQHIQFCVVELDRQKYSYATHRTRGAERREYTYAKLIEETEDIDEIQEQLVEVMDALHDAPHIVEIELLPAIRENNLQASWGLSRLMEKLGTQVPLNDLRTNDGNAAFTDLMMAFDLATYFPDYLDCFACNLRFHTFDRLLGLSPAFGDTWSCLYRLELGFELEPNLWHPPHTSALEKFFAAATSLSSLAIYFHNDNTTGMVWAEHSCVKWLAAATSHMKLDVIILVRTTARVRDLIALLATHAQSLRRLGLNTINLPASECWSTFFSSLGGLALDCLNMDHLRTGCIEDDHWRAVGNGGLGGFEIEGKEEVSLLIEDLARDPQYIEL